MSRKPAGGLGADEGPSKEAGERGMASGRESSQAYLALNQGGHGPGTDNSAEGLAKRLGELVEAVARRFGVLGPRGKPRAAAVVELVGRYACLSCLRARLEEEAKGRGDDVDRLHRENHALALNLLVERLIAALGSRGYRVAVNVEAKRAFSRADIEIVVHRNGLDIRRRDNSRRVVVEVKTGQGFSWAQIFRLSMDRPGAALILWRVRLGQVLRLDGERLEEAKRLFCEMCIQRMERLLAADKARCEHREPRQEPPNASRGDCQELVDGFFDGLVRTVDEVVARVVGELEKQG